ncbi:MAG: helix-turn-helix domain-containing protein, partial [Stellaceae bacterium]
EGPDVTAADLELQSDGLSPDPGPAATSLKEARKIAEREALKKALALADGSVTQAARLLDISRPTLYDLMRHHDIHI